MTNYRFFSPRSLENTTKAAYCNSMGVETHIISGSRTVNTADSRNHSQTHCILGLQGRRKPGMTYDMFPTLQALFISGVETGKGQNINDLIIRRSVMKDHCVPLPPCADSGAVLSQQSLAIIRQNWFTEYYPEPYTRLPFHKSFTPGTRAAILQYPKDTVEFISSFLTNTWMLMQYVHQHRLPIEDLDQLSDVFRTVLKNLYVRDEKMRINPFLAIKDLQLAPIPVTLFTASIRREFCNQSYRSLFYLRLKFPERFYQLLEKCAAPPQIKQAVKEYINHECALECNSAELVEVTR